MFGGKNNLSPLYFVHNNIVDVEYLNRIKDLLLEINDLGWRINDRFLPINDLGLRINDRLLRINDLGLEINERLL